MKDYYQSCFNEYHQLTFRVDPASFLSPLAKRLNKSDLILDVGYGLGRDLPWFKDRGHSVVGFEKSEGPAELAITDFPGLSGTS